MYKKILITLDATPTDRAILDHMKPLARLMESRVVLLHVADGWAARWYGPDAVSREVEEDTAYLAKIHAEFASEGLWRSGNRDRAVGQGAGVRPCCHEHPWASPSRRPVSRNDCHPRTA